MSYLCPHCSSFPMEDYVWWVSGEKKHTNWWCAICGEQYDWKQSNMLLVVQTGESVNQAKVFRAHVVPQGLCGNLINALKLLANQQEDGGGLTQNIVAKLCEESRKGLTEGLREFTNLQSSSPGRMTLEGGHEKISKYEGRKEKKDTRRCLSGKAPMN